MNYRNSPKKCPLGGLTATCSIAIACLLLMSASCEPFSKNSDKKTIDAAEMTKNTEVLAKFGDLPPLQIELAPSHTPLVAGVGSLVVLIKNAPPLARFECDLSGQQVDVCVDGSILNTPLTPGEYQLNVFAYLDSNIVGQGTSDMFKVEDAHTKNSSTDPTKDAEHPLSIKISTIKQNEADIYDPTKPIILKKSIKTEFNFQVKDPKSCSSELVVYCRIGNNSNLNPWIFCNSNQSFSLSGASQALGRQNIEIEARCGDSIGPRLSVPFDAVPDNYEPMKLTFLSDPSKRYFLFPVREADCESDDRRFECRALGATFARCTYANILKEVTEPVEVRLVCLDKTGPILTIQP